MKRTFVAIALTAWCAAFAHAQQVRLDVAIQSAAEDLSAGVGRGNRVAVIAMESDSGGLSGYLVSEMIHALVRLQGRHGFMVMDRAQLDLLLAQLEFDMSDFVDTNTAQRVGRFMGVQSIVVGDFEPVGAFFRFRARVIEVETAAIRGSYAAFVQNDEIIASLRGATGGTAAQQPPSRTAAPAGMVRVEGGTRVIGGRNVTLTTFNIGRHPVTQGEWYDLMGTRPSRFTGADWRNLPVESVSWWDAIEYANAKSRRAGLTPAYTISGTGANRTVTWNRGANGYRLPTEAEWEFAARGGMVCRGNYEFAGSNAVGEVAWYNGNSGGSTQPVGMLRSNALGIHDMSGNVLEWVWDWFGTLPTTAQTNPVGPAAGVNRVSRGGSWDNTPAFVRSAHRNLTSPGHWSNLLGFRLARP